MANVTSRIPALAGRLFLGRPGLTAAAVLSLALAIGANTAIFSVVDAVLFAPLPYAQPEEIVRLWETYPHPRGVGEGSVSIPNYRDWKAETRSFSELGAYAENSFNLTGEDLPVRLPGAALTGSTFALLGVEAELGRTFTEEEVASGREHRVVLSHDLWQSRYEGRPDAVGRDLVIDGESHTIVGVMPEGFEFPAASRAKLWKPLVFSPDQAGKRGSHWLQVLGRLAPGKTLDDARAEMDALAARIAELHPETQEGRGALVRDLGVSVAGFARPVLLGMWGAVGLVLLIGCANVASLLLAHTYAQKGQYALRAALGASKGRIAREVLVRGAALAAAGGALGTLFAHAGVEYLTSLTGDSLPLRDEVAIDWRVLLFTLAVSVGAALVSSLVPALRAARVDLRGALQEGGSRGGGMGGRRGRLLGGLVISEIALAQLVLVGAALVLASLLHLRAVDPGLDAEDVITLQVSLPESAYPTPGERGIFWDRLRERVEAVPGVESAGLINLLPLDAWGYNGTFGVEGIEAASAAEEPYAEFRWTSPGYFRSLGIPLVDGRLFDERDVGEDARAVLINRTLAERYWDDGEAVGGRIAFGNPEENGWLTVVGVVEDVRNAGLSRPVQPELHFPHHTARPTEMTLVVKSAAPAVTLIPTLRAAVAELDASLPIYRASTMEEVVAADLARWRAAAMLFGCFAGLALLLALTGVYGILAYEVTQRTSEIGLRMALGAEPRGVLALVLRRGLGLALAGILAGVGAALLLSRYLASQLYEVSPTEPSVMAAASLFLLLVAAAACWLPALRARRLDPIEALRREG